MPSSNDNGEESETNERNEHSERSPSTAGRRSHSGDPSPWSKALRDVAPYLDFGWRLAAATAFPPLLGYLLVDAWLGTAPVGVLSGAALGLASAALQIKRLHEDLNQ